MGEEKTFCEQCGHPLEAGAKFCEGCGLRVAPAARPLSDIGPARAPRGQNRLPWIIGGVALVVLGGVAGGYYWGKSGGSRPAPPAATAPVPAAPKTGLPAGAGTRAGAFPGSPGAEGGREAGFATLPPPPPLDGKGETSWPSPPPDVAQDLPAGASQGLRWPWTSQRPVTQGDLNRLSREELALMRNEIYARHGWVFERADLRDYFGQQAWYRPKGALANREAANRWAAAELTPLERRNVKTILEYEKGN